ncbi:iron ABC transporter permease [Arcanobacterium haemolyticum]|nr:iron ABC transporter permease [Arcanobacterium haemolyticum]
MRRPAKREPHSSSGIERRRSRRAIVFSGLIVVLLASVVLSAAIGQYHIGVLDVLRAIGSKVSLGEGPADPVAVSTLWSIRFPRIVLGIFVGAALAVAGTVMQSVFSNPLAEPGIVGVSAGASVGASLAMVMAPAALGGFSVPVAAFVSGLIAVALVYVLSRSGGKAEVLTLVLTGIAVAAVCTAVTSMATYVAPTTARDQIVFWQMGSLNAASWTQVGTVGVVVVVGLVWAVLIAKNLDTLALGERAAGHVGVNVHALRVSAIVLCALLTSAAVAYAGVIAFVGLIVPHVLRLAIGPLNRFLIPASALGGALLITLSDLTARNLIPFADLPIGIFTALVGGPTFFVLLRTKLRSGRVRS